MRTMQKERDLPGSTSPLLHAFNKCVISIIRLFSLIFKLSL